MIRVQGWSDQCRCVAVIADREHHDVQQNSADRCALSSELTVTVCSCSTPLSGSTLLTQKDVVILLLLSKRATNPGRIPGSQFVYKIKQDYEFLTGALTIPGKLSTLRGGVVGVVHPPGPHDAWSGSVAAQVEQEGGYCSSSTYCTAAFFTDTMRYNRFPCPVSPKKGQRDQKTRKRTRDNISEETTCTSTTYRSYAYVAAGIVRSTVRFARPF